MKNGIYLMLVYSEVYWYSALARQNGGAIGFALIFCFFFIKKKEKQRFTIHLIQKVKMIEIKNYGLVVCGGKSSRMHTHKSMLQYFDKPQRYHVYDMLLFLCEKVFISCNEEQSKNMEAGYDFMKDDESFGDIGPMKALLTAFTKWPGSNLLFIGCDYPFLTGNELTAFSKLCKNEAAAFYNAADEIYEPLLAWYPHNCFTELKRMHEAKEFSLQAFLKAQQAAKYLPANSNCIQSIDTTAAFEAACKLINAQ